MSRGAIIVIALCVVLVAGVAIVPRWLEQRRKSAIVGQCAELEAERSRISGQGGDAARIAALNRQIAECNRSAKAAGVSIDLGLVQLEACTTYNGQIAEEWAHYRSTSRDDQVKRQNTLNTIYRLGEAMSRCFGETIDRIETVEGADEVRAALAQAIQDSNDRATCLEKREAGCRRHDVATIENHEGVNARAERARVFDALRTQYDRLMERRGKLAAGEVVAPSLPFVLGAAS